MLLFWGLSQDSSSNWISGIFKMLTCPTEGGQLSQFWKSRLHKDCTQKCFQSWTIKRRNDPNKSLIIKHTMTLLSAGEDVQMARDLCRPFSRWPDFPNG